MLGYSLEGKVALVTGGSRGIGAAIVKDLAENGADVAFTYRSQEARAAQVASEVEALGRKVLAIRADVSILAEAERVVAETIRVFGRVDILVNNAGINRDGVIWKMSEEDWDAVLNTNLKGYFNMVRTVAPYFKEQKSGRIVNITSINGLRGKFGQSNYAAAKAGIIGFTKSVARELAAFNVTVNAVAPGLIETDMVKAAPESVREKALAEIVLGRLGQPEDVAYAVTFLCSDRAKHITGEVLRVDGGQYI